MGAMLPDHQSSKSPRVLWVWTRSDNGKILFIYLNKRYDGEIQNLSQLQRACGDFGKGGWNVGWPWPRTWAEARAQTTWSKQARSCKHQINHSNGNWPFHQFVLRLPYASLRIVGNFKTFLVLKDVLLWHDDVIAYLRLYTVRTSSRPPLIYT